MYIVYNYSEKNGLPSSISLFHGSIHLFTQVQPQVIHTRILIAFHHSVCISLHRIQILRKCYENFCKTHMRTISKIIERFRGRCCWNFRTEETFLFGYMFQWLEWHWLRLYHTIFILWIQNAWKRLQFNRSTVNVSSSYRTIFLNSRN